MKALFIALIILLAGCPKVEKKEEEVKAKIVIKTDKVIRNVPRRLFGQLIEVMGRSIYGGIVAEEGAVVEKVWDDIRTDVFRLTKILAPTVIRWPGGLYADTYNWMDGIGPERPYYEKNPYWDRFNDIIEGVGLEDPNTFGTDEFVEYIKKLGEETGVEVEPYINVNVGSGTAEEAANWVEYVNGASDSEFGSLRAKYGHSEPYKVKIWGVGNELYGWWAEGYMKADEYAEKFLEFEGAMRGKDPTLELVAVGCVIICKDWNKKVLEKVGKKADYLSIHIFPPGWNIPPEPPPDFGSVQAAVIWAEKLIEGVEEEIKEAGGPPPYIAVDEWSYHWDLKQWLEDQYTLRDALGTASFLIMLIRHSDMVRMANYAQIANILGLITTDRDRAYPSAAFWGYALVREAVLERIVETEVVSEKTLETFSSSMWALVPATENMPCFDVISFVSDEEVSTVIINRCNEMLVKIEVEGRDIEEAELKVLSGDPDAKNDFERIEVEPKVELEEVGNTIVRRLEASSITVIKLK